VLYEMLTGTLPIGRFQPPSAKSGDARSFDPVVLKSLENDPQQRYQNASEVKADVQAAGSGASAAQVPPLPPRPAPVAETAAVRRVRLRRERLDRSGLPMGWRWYHLALAAAVVVLPLPQRWAFLLLAAVQFGLHLVKRPDEFHLPVAPAAPRAMPWTYWIGAFLALAASLMPWLHVSSVRMGGYGSGVTAYSVFLMGVPTPLVTLLALAVAGLATLRYRGVDIGRTWVLAGAGVGLLLALLSLVLVVASGEATVGIGCLLTVAVFQVWTTFEFRFVGDHREARLRGGRGGRRPGGG
jgi:hypothetical protein